MARKKSNSGKGFALGAMLGGLIGGASALLLAPKSGKHMRKDLWKSYDKASDKAHAMADDVRKHSSKLMKKGGAAKKSAAKRVKRK